MQHPVQESLSPEIQRSHRFQYNNARQLGNAAEILRSEWMCRGDKIERFRKCDGRGVSEQAVENRLAGPFCRD